jgi:hypothetical protein
MIDATTPVTDSIDLGALEAKGVKVLTDFTGQPDEFGILKRYELIAPPFRRGCYFNGDRPDSWPAYANRVLPYAFQDSYGELGYGGLFVIFELNNGECLAVVPIAGPMTMTWLHVSPDGRLVLDFGTMGTDPVSCDAPLMAWARSKDVYTACREAWGEAIGCAPVAGSTAWRKDKDYPEVFRYLGWCSWEEYKKKINSDLLVDAVAQIEASGLPIRYMLVDDGHQIAEERRLKSFSPNPETFPEGWGPLLGRRRDDKIKWIGLWHAFQGLWNTLHPENDFGALNEHLTTLKSEALLPKNSPESAQAFYDAMIGSVKEHGFDFVKIDVQASNMRYYFREDNAVQAATNNSRALERAVERDMDGLINCMAHNSVCVFNTRHSAVTRCSIDYKVGNVAKGKSHIFQSYQNTLWLGQTVWGDHDMFHSCDPASGELMAISKAMSAAPIYLSDAPSDFAADHVRPLCYEDGELLRPLAPAAPLPDSVFIDPLNDPVPYRVIAPLSSGAAAIVCYNLTEPTSKAPIHASLTAEDYAYATGMMQPYEGPWRVPDEGLVVYDWRADAAATLGEAYDFELSGFSDRLLHLCPIEQGWAVIGRTDKYLSPAAVEILECSEDRLVIRLRESGPLAVWSARGKVTADGLQFHDAGGGLWKADMETGSPDLEIAISR